MSRRNHPLTAVSITNSPIPFISCHTLVFFVVFNSLYTKNITMLKSNIKDITLSGFWCSSWI